MLAAFVLATVVDLHVDLAQAAGKAHLPAISATVTRADGIVAHGVAGVRRIDKPDPVEIGDAFHIGSCTKPFVATIVATLVEEKKLTWETKIVDVFSEWKTSIRPEYAGVTVAQLLSHEAGLPEFGETEEFDKLPRFEGSAVDNRRAFARYILTSMPPVVPPGTAFSYSNAGYSVAAAIAEKIAGKPWDALANERIFGPLKMTTAGTGWPADVWGHEPGMNGALKPVDPKGPYQLRDLIGPAGDLHMSSDDLAAFLRAHLRAMRGETSLITPATAAVMHTKRIKTGLGFGVNDFAGFKNVATHSGSADTFVTVIAIAPKQNVAVAVSKNVATPEAMKAVGAVLKDLLTRFAQ